MKILSFGAGVNSTAILVLHAQGTYMIDVVIFADTQNEHPETYQFIDEIVRPFCEEINLPFHLVSKGNLYEDYWQKKIIPFRMVRSCSDHYKIRVIQKFITEKYGLDLTYVLGFDYGERNRAEKYVKELYEFPLIEMKIDRTKCKRIIKEFGWKVPVKSGCFFCPFQKRNSWIRLLKRHRELFLRAEVFEKNGSKYPKYNLSGKPLEEIRALIDENKDLCGWMKTKEEPCIFCHS